jgi:hypothetical protein
MRNSGIGLAVKTLGEEQTDRRNDHSTRHVVRHFFPPAAFVPQVVHEMHKDVFIPKGVIWDAGQSPPAVTVIERGSVGFATGI